MTFLPIVDRELRVRARLRSTYRFRVLAATGAILIVGILLLGSVGFGPSPRLGSSIFTTLAGLAFLYCLMEGARNTADCLSREKREGTLGLLFLTDLRGYDVVLGKLAANSLNSVYGLLAIFPALAIPLVLGGVTAGEFWRQVLSLLNALFFSLAVGLLVSAVSRDERRTWSATSALVLGVTVAPPFLLLLPGGSVFSHLAALSPFSAFLGAFDAAYAADPDPYWNSLRLVQAEAWTALIAAAVLLPRAWQDRPVRTAARLANPGPPAPRSEPHTAGPASASRPRPGPRERDRRRRAWQLEQAPARWLAGRPAGSRAGLWTFVTAVGAIGLIGWIPVAGTGIATAPLLVAMVAVHLTLSVWVASEACHALGAARDSGALELLVCTPLKPKEIIDGHLLAMRDSFLRPVATLVGVELILVSAQTYLNVADGIVDPGDVLGPVLTVLLIAVGLLELQAVATYGLWQGLTNRRPAVAVTKTVLHVVVLPLLAFACGPFYILIAFMKNALFGNYGRDQLRRHFRSIVTNQFADAPAELVTDPTPRQRAGRLPPILATLPLNPPAPPPRPPRLPNPPAS